MAQQFFASCPTGLEAVLASELSALGALNVAATRGGASFEGGWSQCYRVNLWSRIASRVLWKLATHPYRNENEVYRHCEAIPWSKHFHVGRTLRVNVSAIGSPLRSLDFITLRIKDAICDRFRRECGERPSISTSDPDVKVHAFFEERTFTLYLDTSGEALFKRGYRLEETDAPMRENLAAGMLALSQWTPKHALLDPMCGSGTILVEAALIAHNITPGFQRPFGFEQLNNFDAELWKRLHTKAGEQAIREPKVRLFASDRDHRQVKVAQKTLYALGMDKTVSIDCVDVVERTAPANEGILLSNPPYGVRLETAESVAEFYPRLGSALKHHFAGWTAYLFTADMELPKRVGLKPSRRIPLFNGSLECRLFEFKLIAGSLRRRSPDA
ncbi:MAG: class I SAM-dependent RNA methyltransferase [Betaproteobacteria bacterium]|nr:class I SAM-dependent RNA methyltransferase [Betaproteobacteria bacterium]